jgi:xanthine dehydrogenase YagT iron-sulfur-binding subunit
MAMDNFGIVTRRTVLGASAAACATSAIPQAAAARSAKGDDMMVPVALKINGKDHHLTLDPRTTLLDTLREHLRLTGTKKGCDHGQCGACTVIVEGRRINSCLTLAVMHDGDEVTTIEGLGSADKLHPMQKAFIVHDGYQCGYCTPGQICSAVAVLDEIEAGIPSHVTRDLNDVEYSDEEVRERMSGNICRCAAYSNIVAAIRDVAGENAA